MRHKLFLFLLAPNDGGDGGGGGGGDGGGGGGDGGGPAPLVGDDFAFAPDWQSRLGAEAEGLTFKDLPSMVKSVKEGSSTITRLSQEKAELAKQIETLSGQKVDLPADVEGYKAVIKPPEKLPDGVFIPDGMLEAAAKYALDNKISPEVTNMFIAFQVEQAGREAEAFKTKSFAAIEEAKATIKSTVGPQNYDATVEDAKAAHDMLGLGLNADDLIQNPRLVLSLAKIKAKLSPGALKDFSGSAPAAEGKLSQARSILSDPANPLFAAFNDPSHVNHREAMDTYNRLILESGQG